MTFAEYDKEIQEDGFYITETYYEVEEIQWKNNKEAAKKKSWGKYPEEQKSLTKSSNTI